MTAQKQTSTHTQVRIVQIGSPIGREGSQRKTLIGLGLNKIGRQVVLDANPSVMGMVKKVAHLLCVEKV
jgi:large subunit ribosomal protein L30